MAVHTGVLQQKSAGTAHGIMSRYAFWQIDGRRVDEVIIEDYLDSLVDVGHPVRFCQSANGWVVAVEMPSGERIGTKLLSKAFAGRAAPVILVYGLISLPLMLFGGLGILAFAGLLYLYPGRGILKMKRDRDAFLLGAR